MSILNKLREEAQKRAASSAVDTTPVEPGIRYIVELPASVDFPAEAKTYNTKSGGELLKLRVPMRVIGGQAAGESASGRYIWHSEFARDYSKPEEPSAGILRLLGAILAPELYAKAKLTNKGTKSTKTLRPAVYEALMAFAAFAGVNVDALGDDGPLVVATLAAGVINSSTNRLVVVTENQTRVNRDGDEVIEPVILKLDPYVEADAKRLGLRMYPPPEAKSDDAPKPRAAEPKSKSAPVTDDEIPF